MHFFIGIYFQNKTSPTFLDSFLLKVCNWYSGTRIRREVEALKQNLKFVCFSVGGKDHCFLDDLIQNLMQSLSSFNGDSINSKNYFHYQHVLLRDRF